MLSLYRTAAVDFKKLGAWTNDDLCWFFYFLWFGVGGRSCFNCLASTVGRRGSHVRALVRPLYD